MCSSPRSLRSHLDPTRLSSPRVLQYDSPEAFFADIKKIHENCHYFNTPGRSQYNDPRILKIADDMLAAATTAFKKQQANLAPAVAAVNVSASGPQEGCAEACWSCALPQLRNLRNISHCALSPLFLCPPPCTTVSVSWFPRPTHVLNLALTSPNPHLTHAEHGALAGLLPLRQVAHHQQLRRVCAAEGAERLLLLRHAGPQLRRAVRRLQ